MGRGLSQKTVKLIERADELWEDVNRPQGIVPTIRQYFYKLSVDGLVPSKTHFLAPRAHDEAGNSTQGP